MGNYVDAVDIDQADEAVAEASADVKEYTAMVLKQIDNLKINLHGELAVNDRPEEDGVQVKLDRMFDTENEERGIIINKLKRRLDTIKNRQKRKTFSISDLENVRTSRDKDRDSALSPGILAYDATLAGLET